MKQVLNFPAAPVRMRILLRYRLNMYDPLSYFHFFIFVCSLVENVQWRATRFILNYLRDMSYTERLVKTNLLPLDLRREISDLLLLHKSRNGLVSTNLNNLLSTFRPRHQTRSFVYVSDTFFIVFYSIFLVKGLGSKWDASPVSNPCHF